MRCMPIPIIMYLPILYTLCCYKIPSPEWNKGCSALCITISQSIDNQQHLAITQILHSVQKQKINKKPSSAAQQGGYDRCGSHWVLIYAYKDLMPTKVLVIISCNETSSLHEIITKTIDTDKNFRICGKISSPIHDHPRFVLKFSTYLQRDFSSRLATQEKPQTMCLLVHHCPASVETNSQESY